MGMPLHKRRRRIGLSRRGFLKAAGAVTATLATASLLEACGSSGSPEQGPSSTTPASTPVPPGTYSFKHGVASGDPEAHSLLLWTRVTPGTAANFPVEWRIATDVALSQVLASGSFTTGAARDYTVKVEPAGLAPDTTYYYQFNVGATKSPIGRARTTPLGDTATPRLRFAFTSCAWLTMGYFNGYRKIAQRRDLNAVMALGDYIYEYGPNDAGGTQVPGRTFDPPNETITLADYRRRHANYKADADLQQAHRQHPWICVWDDHESANDSYTNGAQNHTEGTEGKWTDRKAASIQAYFEWMPVRERYNPMVAGQSLYRRVRYGTLAEFFMLDTRLEGRDKQAANAAEGADSKRLMMSTTQEKFLLDGLKASTAQWKIIGQQTTLSQILLAPGQPYTRDSWDGYEAQRLRLFAAFAGVPNVAVITGDIHTAFAYELTATPADTTTYTPGIRGSVGIEFTGPSITSVGFPAVDSLYSQNRNLRYAAAGTDGGHGYVLLDITTARYQGEWYYSSTVLQPSDTESVGGIYKADAGKPYLTTGTASVPDATAAALAP